MIGTGGDDGPAVEAAADAEAAPRRVLGVDAHGAREPAVTRRV
jgi:hypothetical protein